MWFLDRLVPGNPFYNMAAALPFGGHVDVDVLRRSFRELVRRHEVYRLFRRARGRPVQFVGTEDTVCPSTSLMQATGDAPDDRIARLASAEAQRPFNLQTGPLLRVTLVRTPRESVLVLVMHHIVSDGWSMDIFFNELQVLYGVYPRALSRRSGNLTSSTRTSRSGSASGCPGRY